MHIALFHASLPEPDRKVGGVDIVVHRLAEALLQYTSHEVTVLSLSTCPEGASYSHVNLFPGVKWLSEKLWARWSLLPVLMNGVDTSKYDVLHVHGDDWFWLRRQCPTIRTFHGSALEESRSASSLKRWLTQRIIYPLEHLSARISDITLAVGPKTAELYPHTRLVKNGVDLSTFTPGPKTNQPSILFLGTWDGRKRGRFLFDEYCKHVASKLPNSTLYIVAGSVPDRVQNHPNVEFISNPSDEILAGLYRKVWVFAYPSVYEGFGIPYIEAMASGTAIVCSSNEGSKYVLENGTYGRIVSDQCFGHSLLDLLCDERRRKRLQRIGMQRASDFSWETVAKDHVLFYESAISNYLSS